MFNPGDFHLSLNGNDRNFSPTDAAERHKILQALASCQDADLSIEHGDGAILTVLLNPQRAFVMWMKEAGDEGQHAIDERADSENVQEFVLSNGQVDEFGDRDTISRELAPEAIAYFIETRQPSPRLRWVTP